MLLTIAEFRNRVERHLPELIVDLQAATGRSSPEETAAWASSLPAVSNAFQAPIFQPLHLYFGSGGGVCLEYRLPASSSWCDMVLLGSHQGKPSAVMLELKHWDTAGDVRGPNEHLIKRHTGLSLHPSDQVRAYVEYCRHFHSAVLEWKAGVNGCVLFTKDRASPAYELAPYTRLVEDFPVFSVKFDADRENLAQYFRSRLSKPDPVFAESFVTGWYDQNRSFVKTMAKTIARSQDKSLVLLGRQRFGYAMAKAEVERAVGEPGGSKKVIIVDGPPGSGKSVIAAKVWADVAGAMERGRCVLTSTSKAQETNWKHLFARVAAHHGAGGVVMPANKYAPATIRDLGIWKRSHPGAIRKPAEWRANMGWMAARGIKPAMTDEHFEVSIVDEAHALINPEHPRAITNSGWPNNFGPQAYHIIRASRVSVFLLDPKQGFRERESTSVDEIEKWAHEFGVTDIKHVSLEGLQFRCAGSAEYVEWIDMLLGGSPAAECSRKAIEWARAHEAGSGIAADARGAAPHQVSTGVRLSKRPGFAIQICDTPEDMEHRLRERILGKETARLVASFSRPWKTEGHSHPYDLVPRDQDFFFAWKDGPRSRTWSRPWNVTPRSDYSHFVQAEAGTRVAIDPLAEVGCTYAVRGFDFDYIGLLWLEDLVWRDGQWVVNLEHVHESGLHSTLKSARRRSNPDPQDREAVLDSVMQAYRILLTRAIKGVYVWCIDVQTREHLNEALGRGSPRE